MALTFPYALATFADVIKIREASFKLSFGQEFSGQGSGMIRAKDLRPPLWRADVTTVIMKLDEANDVQALLEGLTGSMETFYLYNPLRPYPKMGQVDDSTCQIKTLGTDGKSLSLKGLTAGDVISRGDMLSFTYGASSSLALHRALESQTVDGFGNTGEFEVSGPIRSGAAVDDDVTLNKPYGEFRISSDIELIYDSPITMGFSFSCIQVL